MNPLITQMDADFKQKDGQTYAKTGATMAVHWVLRYEFYKVGLVFYLR